MKRPLTIRKEVKEVPLLIERSEKKLPRCINVLKIYKQVNRWPWECDWLNYKERYKTYMVSPHWRANRMRCVMEAKRECEACQNRNRLTVHHLTYENMFNEKPEDLICLCWLCHKIAESESRAFKKEGRFLNRMEMISRLMSFDEVKARSKRECERKLKMEAEINARIQERKSSSRESSILFRTILMEPKIVTREGYKSAENRRVDEAEKAGWFIPIHTHF